jgi:hypothetical protein
MSGRVSGYAGADGRRLSDKAVSKTGAQCIIEKKHNEMKIYVNI